MRRLLPLLALVLPALAFAQAAPPPKLEPIPEPPPPPIGVTNDQAGPSVTIQPGGEKTEEYTVDGQKYIRVTQPNGNVYYLVEARPGDAPWAGANNSDTGFRATMWRILQW